MLMAATVASIEEGHSGPDSPHLRWAASGGGPSDRSDDHPSGWRRDLIRAPCASGKCQTTQRPELTEWPAVDRKPEPVARTAHRRLRPTRRLRCSNLTPTGRAACQLQHPRFTDALRLDTITLFRSGGQVRLAGAGSGQRHPRLRVYLDNRNVGAL